MATIISPPVARRLSALAASLALHLLAALAILQIGSHLARVTYQAGTSAPSIVVVHLGDAPGLTKADLAPYRATNEGPEDLGIRLPDGESKLSLPGFAFGYEKVVKRANALFPFLTGRVGLERLMSIHRHDRRTSLVNPFSRHGGAASRKPPLVMRDAELQALLDKCWSRRERWLAFQPVADLTRAYHPDAGDLPALLNRYGVENGLQPYADTAIRDPRLWAQLGLAADHVDFIDFVSSYVSEHGSSKSTTELLFLLDKLIQASFDALTVLLETDPTHDLEWTRSSNRAAFRAIVVIQDYYKAVLERLSLVSRDDLRAYYGAARIAVLGAIVEYTPNGYRANDARFAAGAIGWKLGKRDEAIRVWREMTVVATDNDVAEYSDILEELRLSGTARPDARAIARILDRQQSRWISRSYDRLRRFGYRFDTF